MPGRLAGVLLQRSRPVCRAMSVSAKRKRGAGDGAGDGGARASRKRPAQYATGHSPQQTLLAFLTQVHATASTRPETEHPGVEVELRLGMGVRDGVRLTPFLPSCGVVPFVGGPGARFDPGVTASSHARHSAAFSAHRNWSGRQTETSMYLYPESLRLRWDPRTRSGQQQRKTRLAEESFLMPSAACDFRIAAALEEPGEADVAVVPPDWLRVRKKRRWCYTSAESPWQVDITTVVASPGDKVNHEIEIELLQEACVQWLGMKDAQEASDMTALFATTLWNLLYLLNPIDTDPEFTLVAVADSQGLGEAAVAVLAQAQRQLHSGRAPSGPCFPGSMPVSFSQRHFRTMQESERPYLVSEKTDGTRYLMLVVSPGEEAAGGGAPTAVLVDRKLGVYAVPGGGALGAAFGLGTVLDGELVYDRARHEHEFLAFDCLANRGLWLLGLYLSKRLEQLSTAVARAQAASPSSGAGGALLVTRKTFFARLEMDRLQRLVSMEGADRVYKQAPAQAPAQPARGAAAAGGSDTAAAEAGPGPGLHHRTDGFLFHPDTKYQGGRDGAFFKWKYADLISLDVLARPHRDQLQLVCAGPKHGTIDVSNQIHIEPRDVPRIRADMPHSNGAAGDGEGLVVELRYIPATGLWGYLRARPDKKAANYIGTALGTALELAGCVPIEELVYRTLCRSPEEDDYARQLGKMRLAALKFKRDTLAAARKAQGRSAQPPQPPQPS